MLLRFEAPTVVSKQELAARLVVVSDEDARGVGERVEAIVHRVVEVARAAPREVTSSGPGVLDEERVADEDCVLDRERDARGRVTRRPDDPDAKASCFERLAVPQETIELTPVQPKLRAEVEDPLEGVLHLRDPRSDGDACVELTPQELGGGEVVGVGMRLEDVVRSQPLLLHEGDDLLRRADRCLGRKGIEVEHRIDDHGITRRGVERDETSA